MKTVIIGDTLTKTVAFCVSMTQPLWGTKRVCLLDLGFGYMLILAELERKGVFGMTLFTQKEVGCPNRSDAWNVLHHMQGRR